MIDLITINWKIEGIETIIFDKDGTLTDAHRYWGRIIQLRTRKIIQTYNLSSYYTDSIRKNMGWDIKYSRLLAQGPIALVSRKEVIRILHRFLVEDCSVNTTIIALESIFDEVNAEFQKELLEYITVLPGVFSFLGTLKQANIKMGIVTSDSIETLPRILSYLGISDYFDVLIGRESSSQTKESGYPCELALNQMYADPRTTIVIGDAPVDIQMAKINNVKGVGVATGQISIAELGFYTPYIVSSMESFTIRKNHG